MYYLPIAEYSIEPWGGFLPRNRKAEWSPRVCATLSKWMVWSYEIRSGTLPGSSARLILEDTLSWFRHSLWVDFDGNDKGR